MTPKTSAPPPSRALPAAVAWTLLVLAVTLWPGDSFPALGEDLSNALPASADKVVHAALFAFETLFVARALVSLGHQRPLLAAVAAAASLAALTELLQISAPGRDGELADFAADQLGIAVYAGIAIARRAFSPDAGASHQKQASLTGYES